MEDKKIKIVIVGAGFGGIKTAKTLNKNLFNVTLIDKNNYHNFQPLLYQVASGGLEPDSIAYPIRRIFRKQKNFFFRMAEVQSVDSQKNTIQTSIGDINYDVLILATGGTNNFYNFEPVKDRLLVLKTVPDALNLRSYLMQNLEQSLTVSDEKKQTEKINIAIVGGGPTGVELAGALSEMKRYVLPKDFPELNLNRMHIYLFEAADRMLSSMSQKSSEATLKFLLQLGVNVNLKAKVKSYDGSVLTLDDGSEFSTQTVIWTAGVKGAPIIGFPAENLTTGSRIKVDEFNRVVPFENIYAIGDVAACVGKETPGGLPMLAPVAVHQGKLLAENLYRISKKQKPKPFIYNNKGVMATVGRQKAVVDMKHNNFAGFFAWFVWMFVHLMSLVGFRNKIVTLIGWVSNYFNYDRPLGLIIRKYKRGDKEL
jgi:NADH dehydrogenase